MKLPSVESTAFKCPHCSAYTAQQWSELFARSLDRNGARVPYLPDLDTVVKQVTTELDITKEAKEKILKRHARVLSGKPFFESVGQAGGYTSTKLENTFASECYTCGELAVWIHRSLVFPRQRFGPAPNPDLPEDIVSDYEEARAIVNESPRGAAALLRLCVQKLCAHLGERGKNIDDDIASLVKKGLDPLLQQSLDIVRVVGNEAVHPGTMDLRDDHDTATRMFDLINAVAQQMISHPKVVRELYERLPEAKRSAIQKRDQDTPGQSNSKD